MHRGPDGGEDSSQRYTGSRNKYTKENLDVKHETF